MINNISMTSNKKSRSKSKTNKTNKTSKIRNITKVINTSKIGQISLFRPSTTQNYEIEIKDKDVKIEWKHVASKKESLFYNYPTDLLVESVYQFRKVMDKIAKSLNITIKDNDIYPNRVLEKFNDIKKSVKPYSTLGEIIRTEYIKNNNIVLKSFPDSYIQKKNVGNVSSILYHQFIYNSMTLHYYFIINKYDLLPNNFDENMKILNIGHHLSFPEAVIYKYINRSHSQLLNISMFSELLTFVFNGNYNNNDAEYMQKIYKYDNVNKIDNIWKPEELEDRIVELSGIDLCYVDSHILLKEYGVIRTNYNHMLMLGSIILAMGTLNKGGNMLLSLPGLSTKFSQDLIVLIHQYFGKVILFKTEIQEPHYNTVFVLATNFQNKDDEETGTQFMNDMEELKKVYAKMYNMDSTGGLAYVPNEPELEKILGIPHQKSNYTYINNLINVEGSVIYAEINSFLQYRLNNYNDFLNSVEYYFDDIINNKEKHNRIQILHTHKSIQIANYLGLKINPYLDIEHIQSDIINDIYRNLYSIDDTVYYKFKLYPKTLESYKPKLEKSNQFLLEQILRMENATRVFDIKKKEDYDKLKKNLRFYEKTLNKLLVNEYNVGVPIKNGKYILQPSGSWFKMYEIAEVSELIPKKVKNYKVMCFCETPGNFILAINHYVKTQTEIQNFDWVAQSYNPNINKNTRDIQTNDDDYELMNKYPNKWDYGPKNTGDITDPDNIKYYGTVYNDIDLLTSDCGTDWSGDDLISSKLMYSQLLFILNNLPKGKNFVIKYYIPFIHYPAQLSLFYMIYQSFEEISFYKPLQNAWSHEFYLIGKKYKGLKERHLQHLFSIMENYNPYMCPIDLDKIPDEFYKQIEKVTRDVVDRFVFYIERYIHYLNLIEDSKKPNFDIVQKHIEIRNKEWINTFHIKKINDADKI